jgi:hypothetical protein
MMSIDLRLGYGTFKIVPDENASTDEQMEIGRRVLDLLQDGYQSEDNAMLRKAKKRFRELRRYDELRELANPEELGLPKLDRPRVVRMDDGTSWWWLPDWECLSWTRLRFAVFRVNGRLCLLPLTASGELLLLLCDRHLRLLRGWSQSYIEKHARDLRDLNETPANRVGKNFVVETIPFFLRWGDVKYPFLTPHFSPFNPFVDAYSQVTRVRS